ncbi:MAG: 2-phospho-L-lactate guanylyltransferase [Nitrosopumilus sp.]|nr:MAG: 2-phospho-L-lactate guanylyltransferase [Nitrosopumilus sp.]
MKIAAIIPVKTFSKAKTRLDLSPQQVEDLCMVMLEEILHTISISPHIENTIIVTKEEKAIAIGGKFNAIIIKDEKEESVNSAVALADKYLLENNFHASIVFPQDIPFIKTQDIDFMLNYKTHPNFAIIVPSRRFDGTNALARMPIDLMKTHYDEDSYKIHMNTAKKNTLNVAMVFVKRIMLDIDNIEDIKFALEQNEKPEIREKIKNIIE